MCACACAYVRTMPRTMQQADGPQMVSECVCECVYVCACACAYVRTMPRTMQQADGPQMVSVCVCVCVCMCICAYNATYDAAGGWNTNGE